VQHNRRSSNAQLRRSVLTQLFTNSLDVLEKRFDKLE